MIACNPVRRPVQASSQHGVVAAGRPPLRELHVRAAATRPARATGLRRESRCGPLGLTRQSGVLHIGLVKIVNWDPSRNPAVCDPGEIAQLLIDEGNGMAGAGAELRKLIAAARGNAESKRDLVQACFRVAAPGWEHRQLFHKSMENHIADIEERLGALIDEFDVEDEGRYFKFEALQTIGPLIGAEDSDGKPRVLHLQCYRTRTEEVAGAERRISEYLVGKTWQPAEEFEKKWDTIIKAMLASKGFEVDSPNPDFNACFSDAWMRVLTALTKYDPDHKYGPDHKRHPNRPSCASFDTYAKNRIRHVPAEFWRQRGHRTSDDDHIRRKMNALRNDLGREPTDTEAEKFVGVSWARIIRAERGRVQSLTVDESDEHDGSDHDGPGFSVPAPSAPSDVNDLAKLLDSTLGELDEQQEQVLRLRFYRNMTLIETGNRMKLSFIRIWQIEKAAKPRYRFLLRQRLKAIGLDDGDILKAFFQGPDPEFIS